jgi:hypothetical protein
MTKRLPVKIALASFAVVSSAMLIPAAANAATPHPSHVGSTVRTPNITKNGGYVYTYYSDATHTTVVGSSGCGTDYGTQTDFYTQRYLANCN